MCKRDELPEPAAHNAYLITGSPAGVYDPLPWIEPLQAFIRSAERSEDGRRLLRASGDGAGARRPGREIEQGLGRGPPLLRHRPRGAMDERRELDRNPRLAPGPGGRPAAEHGGRGRVGFRPLCRARLDRPAGDLLPVPSRILARLRQGADREALRRRAEPGRGDRLARRAQRQCASRAVGFAISSTEEPE